MTESGMTRQNAAVDADQLLLQAVAQHQAGRQQEAEKGYRAILQIDPKHSKANHNLGVLHLQMQQPANALPYLVTALQANPEHAQYWLTYIDALFQAGQVEAAEQVLALARQQGLQGAEVDALAQHIAGAAQDNRPDDKAVVGHSPAGGSNPTHREIDTLVTLFTAGRLEEAAVLARTMTERFPAYEFGWKALGAVLEQMGRSEEALAPMQKAAALAPHDVEAQYNLGVTLRGLKRKDEAEASFRRALRIQPDYADAHSNLGGLLQDSERMAEAEACYRRSLQIKPDNAAVLSNLGLVLYHTGRQEEAASCYRRALQLQPDSSEAHCNLGLYFYSTGHLREAEASCRKALQIRPEFAEAHSDLGIILLSLRRLDEAEASCRRALQIKPDSALAHNSLGAVLYEKGRLGEAQLCYRRALELNPKYGEAYKNLGFVLKDQGRLAEAKECYHKASGLGFKGARVQEALMLPAIMGTRQEVLESRTQYECNLERLIADHVTLADPVKEVGEANFYLAYHAMNDRDLQVRAATFYEQACPSLLYTAPHCLEPKTGARENIRVGFFSRFLSGHSVSFCFSKIIEVMSLREQFEVTLISHYPIDGKMYSKFDGKQLQVPNDLVTAREMIAGLALDVLVYLDIGMEPLSYFLAYGRLAPVQCVMAGHPVTTGIGNVDYFLSADLWESAQADVHYSEKLIRLPTPPIYFARPAMPEVLKSRQELNLPEMPHLYMCPMRLQKLHPDFDEAIARILQLDGNGVVVLFEDDTWPFWKEMLLNRFEKTIPVEVRERIVFSPWLKNPADFLSAVAAADVLLDPFHFGIGSTAVTSCVAGTPLVTKTGEFMRGKVGTGYCRMLDVPECITEDMESYARLAVGIANDRRLREGIKAKILKNNSVLYENPQPVEDFVACISRLANDGTGSRT